MKIEKMRELYGSYGEVDFMSVSTMLAGPFYDYCIKNPELARDYPVDRITADDLYKLLDVFGYSLFGMIDYKAMSPDVIDEVIMSDLEYVSKLNLEFMSSTRLSKVLVKYPCVLMSCIDYMYQNWTVSDWMNICSLAPIYRIVFDPSKLPFGANFNVPFNHYVPDMRAAMSNGKFFKYLAKDTKQLKRYDRYVSEQTITGL